MRVWFADSVQLVLMMALSGSLLGALALPVAAQDEESLVNRLSSLKQLHNRIAIPQRSELKQPATTVKEWIAQIEASLVQITRVRVEATATGVEIILETASGSLEVPTTRVVGNALIADIPNAVLAQGDFSQANPSAEIALVSVTSLPNNQVQVTITGTDAPPVVEVTTEAQGLVLAVMLGDAGVVEDDAIEIVVMGEQEDGYNPSSASTATRTDTPLRDIPQSIQVVPRQVLEDRNVRTVNEAVETVSGVVDGGTFAGAPSAGGRIIRGFDTSQDGGASIFRDGYRDSTYSDLVGIGTIEQVEVLKGPASVVFGALEPGGIINVITRQPLSEPYYNLALEVGNYGFFQPSLDLSGPLTTDDNVLYRFIASYQRSEDILPFFEAETVTIAPSLTLNLGDRTDLDLYYEYVHSFADNIRPDIVVFSDGSLPPRDFYVGYPNLTLFEITTQRIGYRLNHELNDNWQIRNNVAVAWTDTVDERSSVTGVVDDRFIQLYADDTVDVRENYFANLELLGEFDTGSISHQLLAGVDFNYFFQKFTAFNNPDIPLLDIRNPDYDFSSPGSVPGIQGFNPIESYGVYLQDQITLLYNLKLLIGGRYDWVSTEFEITDFGLFGNTIDEPVQNDGAFSPRIGLVYQSSDTVSLYASYSRSFRAITSGFSQTGQVFEPTRGTQYEIGVKADFLDGRLSTTLAAYHLTRTNVPTSDPANPRFSIQSGEQRSQGIELDIGGEILPGWNVIASYAYTDAEVTEDNAIPEGNQLRGVPKNQASLWTTYTIQQGDLRGLGFALGLFYVSEREGDLENSFQVDGYLRTDAALYYRRGRFNAAINIRNLFDVDYVSVAFGRNAVQRGEPFTIVGSVSWEF